MLFEFTMYGSRYKVNGLYYNKRPSISSLVDNPIVWDNADENVYVDYNDFRLRNSAVLKVEGYDYMFCFVSRGQGYVVRFENNNPYYESYAYNRTSDKGLYACDSITTQTINGVTIVYNDYLDPSGKTDIVIDPNLPYFTDPQEFVNFITGTVEPPYNWQSVPSVSGKNGISLLSIIKSSAINGGDVVSGASADAFDRLEETTKISTLIQGITEETPIIYSDDVNYMSITPTANNTCTLKFYLHGSVIYTLTDVSINAYLSFLIDETNGIMKPSIIYEDS